MTVVYYEDTSADASDCEVRIDGKNIVVSYKEDEEQLRVIWNGTEDGVGHYILSREDGQGSASLHRFKDGIFLEGWWEEQGDEGMCRIEVRE